MPEIDRGGWTLRYELTGSGPELVVMTHGFGATAETWRYQLPALTPAYRVLTWDERDQILEIPDPYLSFYLRWSDRLREID